MRSRVIVLVVAACTALAPLAPALAAPADRPFPGPPDSGVREFTPNDPQYDCSEPDDEDRKDNGGTVESCDSIWDAQSQLWGFAPASTKGTAIHRDPPRSGQPMRSGISMDKAWKTSAGRPDVPVAILDTGIVWNNDELRLQVALNKGELPTQSDLDGDGVVSVAELRGVPADLGPQGVPGLVDAQDAIKHLSNGVDDDGNGYVDDIAGWDFFDDDNDAYDASSYSSARNHGTGRASDAVRQGHDQKGEIGTCPKCTFIPVRVWDTFVVSGDNYAMGAAYSADAGAKVIEVALGALSNSPSAQAATRYAYDKGVTLAIVSSDLNTANHNYPTTYPEAIGVNGTVADTYGLGGAEANEFGLPLTDLGAGAQAPVGTYFRNSNLTQYGAHLHVSAVGDTGSFATGQAAGAFGAVIAAGKDRAAALGGELTPAEVKQIVTLSAEDVKPGDTVGIGVPDPAKEGFDERFAYGRLDMGAAMERVAPGRIPPTVLFRSPRFWQLVDPAAQASLPIVADSGSRAESHSVVVQAARGIEPSDGEFQDVLTKTGLTGKQDARSLGSVPVSGLAALFPPTTDFSRPPLTSVNEYAVTLRARVTDSAGNVGEDRKVVWLHTDPNLLPGFPQFIDRGGESSPRLADLNGDAKLDVITTDSGGRTRVLGADGKDAPFWNGGQGVLAPVLPEAAPHASAPAYRSGVPLPRGVSLTPAVADLDGDGALEVLVTNSAGIVTVYDRFGHERFTVGVNPALSAPPLRTRAYHVKTGLFGAASVADVVASRPGLEIVAGGLDGHVYVWDALGEPVAGFPRSLNSRHNGRGDGGAELITIPTLAQLDGDPQMEIVVAGSEVVSSSDGRTAPETVTDLATAYRTLLRRVVNGTGALGKASLAHAVDGDGKDLPGWPVMLDALVPDVLPFVGPAHQFAAGDVGNREGAPAKDGLDEIVTSNTSGEVQTLNADGTLRTTQASEVGPQADPRITDRSKVLNLFEYASIGDLEGTGVLSAFKGGLTLGGLTNLVLVGQNNPQDHVLQGWDLATGSYRPGFPAKVEDYMLLSQPAIADVDGVPGREVVQGTGLYLIHAFNAAGQEAPGFPKFTGGWNYATPAFGDLDGDGKLEMVSSTREGYLFAWSLDGSSAQNGEWWGAAHDERSTSRHGTDARPPARVQNLRRTAGTVTWNRTGDDWLVGDPVRYVVLVDDVRREQAPSVTSISSVPATSRVEVFAVDDAGNRSLSAVLLPAAATPQAEPTATSNPTPSTTPATSQSASPTAAPSSSPTPSTSPGTGASSTPSATPSATRSATPAASTSATPAAESSPRARPDGAGFHRLTPTRLLDTREQGGAVLAGSDRMVQVRGRAGVPSTGVSAVVVNATVTGVSRSMDLMVYPSDRRPSPRTSNLNAVRGQTVANLVEVAVGADGRIGLSLSAGSSHVVLDVVGWYGEPGAGGDGYVGQAPDRRFDSRESTPIRAGADRVVPLFADVPAGVSSAVVSLTAVGASGNADVQLYAPGDRPSRRTSNLNLRRGQTVANLAVVPVDAQGRVAVSVSEGSVDVVLDLVGWFSPGSDRGFEPLRPARIFDSRLERRPVAAGDDREVTVLGSGDVPTSGVEAVLVNVTSVGSTDIADLQVYPAGERPGRRTSNLNVRAGQTVPVLVAVKVGRDGRIALSTSQGTMHVVLDVVGYVRAAR